MSSRYPKSVFISPDKAKDKSFDFDNLYSVYDIGRFCMSLQGAISFFKLYLILFC